MVDATKLVFSSRFRYERIVLKKSYSFTVQANSTSSVSIAHGLGYVPYVKFFYDFGDGKVFPLFCGSSSYDIDGNLFEVDDISTDSQNMNFEFNNEDSSSVVINVHVRVYAEPQE